MKTILLLLTVSALRLLAADELPRDLDKIEAALKTAPENAMLHYRKCQALFEKGREQEAVDHAAVALAKFKAAGDNLKWMLLGSIKTEKYVIRVLYNMGSEERAEEKDGIVRPLSFRVWTQERESKLLRELSFELAYLDGKLVSTAIGEMTKEGHSNFGPVDSKSDFATIKKRILELIKE